MTKQAKQDASTRNRTYFAAPHQTEGPPIMVLSVYFNIKRLKDKGVAEVGYKIFGGSKHKAPRALTKWLDGQDELFVRKELEAWKKRVNDESGATGRFYPDVYVKHRAAFLKWCAKTAKQSTIVGYHTHLGLYVFPFFMLTLKESNPAKWGDSLKLWNQFLDERVNTPRTRNGIRTALRRYLKFLEARDVIKSVPDIINESEKRLTKEQVVPGERLPTWSEVVAWLKQLPPGRERYIVSIAAAFGIRPSEAMAANPKDIVGQQQVAEYEQGVHIVGDAIRRKIGTLFLHVEEAQKAPIRDQAILRAIGDVDSEPKTGPYIAACIDKEMGQFIARLTNNGEGEGEVTASAMVHYLKTNADDADDIPFSQYRLRDFRRLHITQSAFSFGDLFLVARLHGQKSDEVVKRYYQWEQTRRRHGQSARLEIIEY